MKQAYVNIPVDVLSYLLEENLSKPATKLYLLLRMYKNNGNGSAWIGRAKIAREAHIHKDDIKRARDELQEVGLINVEDRPGKTPLVTFNDNVVPKKGSTQYSRPIPEKGIPTPPEKGDTTPPEKGDTTIKNTNKNVLGVRSAHDSSSSSDDWDEATARADTQKTKPGNVEKLSAGTYSYWHAKKTNSKSLPPWKQKPGPTYIEGV